MGQLIAFGNGVFLTQLLLTSSDGATWTPMQFPPPGMAQVYAGTYGAAGWVLATGGGTDAAYAFGVHP